MNRWRKQLLLVLFMFCCNHLVYAKSVHKKGGLLKRNFSKSADIRFHEDRNVLVANLNQYFYGNSVLPIRRMLNLDQHYRGKRIKKIVLKARPNRRDAQVRLMINNRQVDSTKWLTNYEGKVVFHLYTQNTIGRDIRKIRLHINGDVQVNKIKVKFENTHHDSNQRWWQQVNLDYHRSNLYRNNYAREVIRLESLFNASRLRGVKHIVLKAKPRQNFGMNNQRPVVIKLKSQGQLIDKKVLDNYSSELVELTVPYLTEYALQNLKVITKGEVYIEWIEVGLDRFSHRNTPRQNRDWENPRDMRQNNHGRGRTETYPIFRGFNEYGDLYLNSIVGIEKLKKAKIIKVTGKLINNRGMNSIELCKIKPNMAHLKPQNCQQTSFRRGNQTQTITFKLPPAKSNRNIDWVIKFFGHVEIDQIQVSYF
jgi:hypothetical protein